MAVRNGGYGYGGGGWLPSLIIWVVIIVSIIALVKYMTHHGEYYGHGMKGMREDGSSALNILKERYAKGEIAKKEFEEMEKDIS